MRLQTLPLCSSLVVLLVLAAASPAQQLTNKCTTFMFRNQLAFPVDDILVTLDPASAPAGPFILENVVQPPSATAGTVCPNPSYTWFCTGGPTFHIFFPLAPVFPGQWIAVTVSSPSAITVPGLINGRWDVDGGLGIVAEVYHPPHVVINEISTSGVDWIEIYNYGSAITVSGFRVEVREDPAAVTTVFTFPPGYVIPTCGSVVISDSSTGPTLSPCPTGGGAVSFNPSSVPPTAGNIPWNTTVEGSVYLIAPGIIAGGPERPVDSLAFGYFQQGFNLHPDFPVSEPIQNYTDDSPEQVTLYRMGTCLRCDADEWNNQRLPQLILNGGGSTFPINSATPGCANPGQCTSAYGCSAPNALTLRVSKCPLIIHVDGAVPGSEVFIGISDDIRGTQSSGILMGLNPFSPLLMAIIAGDFLAPVLRGPAVLPSPCGAFAAAKETNFGPVLGVGQCYELAAVGLVRGSQPGSGTVPMVSNVVRIP